MKKRWIALLCSLVAMAMLCFVFAACKTKESKLQAPVLALAEDCSVTWDEVSGAEEYVVNVNGEDLKTVTDCSFAAFKTKGDYSVKVKAKGSSEESDYSAAVEYSVYAVTLTAGSGYTLTGETYAYGGKDYSFSLALNSGYEQSTPTVKANGTALTKGADGKYTVANVASDVGVTVEGIAIIQYDVTLTQGTGYTLTGEQKADYGSDYSFTVALTEGYDKSTPVVKVNGEAVEVTNGTYTVQNVTDALTVTVEGVQLNTYSVTLPSGTGYSVSGETTALHGTAYSFTLAVENGYKDTAPVVKANDEVLTGTEGKYTVANVTGNITVTVQVSADTYAVTLPEVSARVGYEISGASSATYGADYQFTLNLKTGYTNSTPTVTVTVGGTSVEVTKGEGGVYTIAAANVNGAIAVTVADVKKNTYTVTIPTSSAYSITGENSATYGEEYSFTLAVTEGYDATELVVKVNGTALTAGANNTYTVAAENVTSALSISVEGLNIIKYDVTFPTERTGYTVSGGSYKVEHGADYTFTITLAEGYTNSTLIVKAGENVLEAAEGGVYKVERVTEPLAITIEGATLNTYKVSVKAGEGYTVAETTPATVTYGGSTSFTITVTDTTAVLLVKNGDAVVEASDDKYVVSDVKADTELTVKVYDLAHQMYLASNWSGINLTEASDGESASLQGTTHNLSSEYIKKLLNAGYTHLKFTVTATVEDINTLVMIHGGTWNQYWRQYTISSLGAQTFRVDLSEFVSDNAYYGLAISGRTAASGGDNVSTVLTLSDVTPIKSTKTQSWTKDNTNVYFAIEDGFYVLDAFEGSKGVSSPVDWWKAIATNGPATNAGNETLYVYTDWITSSSDNRIVYGWNGGITDCVRYLNGKNEGDQYPSDGDHDAYIRAWLQTYAENDTLHLCLDKAGTVRFKIGEWAMNNYITTAVDSGWCSMSYVSENSVKVTYKDHQNFVCLNLDDWLAEGYKSVTFTLTSADGSAYTTETYVGNGLWSGDLVEQAFSNGSATLDLTDSKLTGYGIVFVFTANVTDLTISWTLNK